MEKKKENLNCLRLFLQPQKLRANVTATIFFHLILLASVPIYDFHYYFIENEGSMAPYLL